MSTHRKCDGATWPSVASRHQRLKWVSRILADEGIQVPHPTHAGSIAFALLKAVANSAYENSELRSACFKAAMELEPVPLTPEHGSHA